MKNINCVFAVSLLLSGTAALGFNKKSASTISPDFSIPHSHIVTAVDGQGLVYRGSEPRTIAHFKDLKNLNTQHILIFKKDLHGEVADEIRRLKQVGWKGQTHHVPMRWSEFLNFQEACEDLKTALLILQENFLKKEATYFHCTVGEDRSGTLDALWNLWLHGESVEDIDLAFRERMCAYGYSTGFDPSSKPQYLTQTIDRDLTPAFLTLAHEILRLKNSAQSLKHIRCGELDYWNSTLTCK